ncbi:glycosyltransferase family 2 protein [uncultured Rothia sp.]|jgi:hypothetical protein|uniref:glycosyltransferase family 2 protein n=1 Tax=uncultured Rothia sp. TaxID=316088 RepID=UPI0025EB41C3|nr:glycosyltransferase family 2 protein [uncultured Rothia sp.]
MMSKTTLLTTAKELKHKLFVQKVNWEKRRKAHAIRNSPEFAQRYAALEQTFTRTELPQGPFIWGITMVKNEADIIEQTIRHLLNQGVEQILVADNGSTDGTYELLQELSKTLPVHVIQDREVAYYQSEKMTWLADQVTEAGAEWIVPFDADEFWYGVSAPLAEVLRSQKGRAIELTKLYNIFPNLDGTSFNIDSKPYWDLKVCFSAWKGAVITMGNHEVVTPGVQKLDEVAIIHYPWRSIEQFTRKMQQGAKALEATDLPEHMGYHWRQNADITLESALPLWKALLEGKAENYPIAWQATGTLKPIGRNLPQSFDEVSHLLEKKTGTGL